MITIKHTLRRVLGFVKSFALARQEAKQARQELKQARRRHKRTREKLKQSRQYLRQASRQYERLEAQNARLGLQFMQMAREYLLYRMPKGSVCAEIGVHEGEFSRRILDTVEPEQLHLIDPWMQGEGLFGKQAARGQATMDERYEEVKGLVAQELTADRVRIHRNLSNEIVDDFEDSYFDWIYVDGNHLYEYVKQDLELYYPKVKDGGYIAGDDYGIPGYWDNGVKKAVDEFVLERLQLVLEVHASQFIIRKGDTG